MILNTSKLSEKSPEETGIPLHWYTIIAQNHTIYVFDSQANYIER